MCGYNETAIKSADEYVNKRFSTVWDVINTRTMKLHALADHIGGKFEDIETKKTIVFSPIQKDAAK